MSKHSNKHSERPLQISLVIPAYNEEKYIGDCLEYALRHKDFSEIIVIDNASTDRTKAIVEKIAKEHPHSQGRLRVVTEMKKGLTRARERGRIEAKGDVIAYVDADTRMPEHWLQTVTNEFTKNPNLAVLSGPYIYHDIPRIQQQLIKILYWNILAMPIYWVVGYMTVGGNFAIRSSALESMGGFDTTIEFYGEDTNIARRASKHGKVKFMPSFHMYTSARRCEGLGVWKTGFIYITNFVSEVMFKKPVTKKYIDIR